MAEAKFDLLSLLQKGGSTPMATEDNVRKWFKDLGLTVDGKIDDFLYKVDPEVLLKEISKEQLKALLKTTFVTKDGKTYRFDLLKCMEENPALARFIVREFGVEGCRDFGFNVNDEIKKLFSSLKEETADFNTKLAEVKEGLKNLLLLLPETELVRAYEDINKKIEELGAKIRNRTDFTMGIATDRLNRLKAFSESLLNEVFTPLRDRLNAVYQACVRAEKDSFGAKIKESLEKSLGEGSFEGVDDNKKIKDDVDFSKALGAFSLFSAKDEKEADDKKGKREEFLNSEMGKYDGADLRDKKIKEAEEEAKKKIKENLFFMGKIKDDGNEYKTDAGWEEVFKNAIDGKIGEVKDYDDLEAKDYDGKKEEIKTTLSTALRTRAIKTEDGATFAAIKDLLFFKDGGKIEIAPQAIEFITCAIDNATKEKEKEEPNRLTYKEAETLKTFLKENGVDLDVLNKVAVKLEFDSSKANNNNDFNVEDRIFIEDINGLLHFNNEGKIDDIKQEVIESLEEQINNDPFGSTTRSVIEKIAITTIIEDGKPISLLEKLVELHKEGKKGAKELLTCLSKHVNAVGAGCFKEDDVVKILGKGDNINDATLLNLFIGNTEVESAEISPSSRELLYNTAERLFNIFSRVAFEGEENERKLREDFAFFDEKGEQELFTRKMVEAANTVKKDIDLLLEGLGDEEKKKKLKDISGVENIEGTKIIKLLNIIEGSEKDKKTIEEELKSFFKDNPTESITKELNKLKESVSEAIKKRKEEEEKQKTKDENKKLRDENKKLRDENKKLKEDLLKVNEKSENLSELERELWSFAKELEKQEKKFEALQNKPRVTNERPKTAKFQGVKTQTQETTKRQQYHDSRDYNNEVVRVIDAILTSTNIKELENNLENVREKVSPEALANGMLKAIQDSINIFKLEGDQSELRRLEDFAKIISKEYDLRNSETKQKFKRLFGSVGISLYPQKEYQPAGREVKIVQQQAQQPNYGQIKIVQQQAQPQGFNLDRQLSTKEYLQCLVDIYTQNVTLMLNLLNRFGVAQANLDMHNIHLNNGISMYI